MSESHEKLLNQFQSEMESAKTTADVEALRVKYLGKKGEVTELLKGLGKLSIEERKATGATINQIKTKIQSSIEETMKKLALQELDAKLKAEKPDHSMPGTYPTIGSLHPVTQVANEVINIFQAMGFFLTEGPEIEEEYYNFEALNVPKHHPARDMQDTFYINPELLLRSQTSPVQVRTMLEKKGQPIKIICPGKVYRRDADDATHSHQFIQCEGLVLGKDISLSDLKGALLEMAKKMLGEEREIRLRPSFFPFTEPSVEVDVSCGLCGGKGCNVCKNTGWIEVLGAGMVNNNVLRMSGYNPDEIQGFAFGIGVERIAMLKYRIDDIRNFYTNDLRFLNQFKEVK